ncbi:MAG TPA: HAD hydrolase-like protein [Spirochaetia bacterium]|jgi:phosphoglycolate phosphatase-like HAD superfamily hydrolase|nr:HAD hydrolase-like protein [Spirochaetia bacterium]
MTEQDYRKTDDIPRTTHFLPGTSIEIIRPIKTDLRIQHVLFDFDGTLSLIREGWPEVMIPMMVEILRSETKTDESDEAIERIVRDFVTELTGKQTIYQMIRLAEEIEKRGGKPDDPAVYKQMYLDRLMERIASRREALRSGKLQPEEMLVPFSIDILSQLKDKGVHMYVASGTDEEYVIEEARLLGLDTFFGDKIYGALSDYKNFSKAMVIERILKENNVPGERLLVFGDGYVEIQDCKAVGGKAIAVASDEAGKSGKPDPWKRERLIGAGADIVIPDYRDHKALIDYLFLGA